VNASPLLVANHASASVLVGSRAVCGCPRCDYDVTGEVDSWVDQCPLMGRCSECGLELNWSELLSPIHLTPRWSFEHARTRLGRAFFGTVSRVLLPWRLTRSLRMHHAFRPWRLALLAGCAVVMLYMSAVLNALPIVLSDLIYSLQHPTNSYFSVDDAMRFLAWPYQNDVYNMYRLTNVIEFTVLLLLWAGVVTALFSVVPITIRKHRVSPRHFVRMGAYCAIGILALCVIEQLICSLSGANQLLYVGTGAWWRAGDRLPAQIGEWMQIASFFWMVVFWWSVFRFYMRLPHALVMSILLNLIGMMIGVILVLFLTGSLR
jgi:hypothetical protein